MSSDSGYKPDKKSDYYLVEPCTSASGFEIKLKKGFTINLKKAEQLLSLDSWSTISSSVVLIASKASLSLSIYASGRIMIKSEKKVKMKENTAHTLAEKLMQKIKNATVNVSQE